MPEDWKQRFTSSQLESALRPQDPAAEAVFCSATSSTIVDTEGNHWLDLVCGFSSLNFGHSFPPLVEIASRQMGAFAHVGGAIHKPGIELAESLLQRLYLQSSVAQETQYRLMFNSSGARGIEAAWKAANTYRPGRLVVLGPSLHGRTIATAAISETRQAELSEALEDRILVWPKEKYPGNRDLQQSHELTEYLALHASEISAVLVEPALTARGYIFPPADFFLELREVTSKLGILMIADEIQTGLGRCSNFLFSLDQGWLPDLFVLGKSLGGGLLPIAVTVGRKDVLECLQPGVESETFAGTPLACTIANEVILQLRDGRYFEAGCRAALELREHLEERLGRASNERLGIAIGGQAASAVLEFQGNGTPLSEGQRRADMFAKLCRQHRLRVQWTGPQQTRIVMLPALTISETELAEAKTRLAATVSDFLALLPKALD